MQLSIVSCAVLLATIYIVQSEAFYVPPPRWPGSGGLGVPKHPFPSTPPFNPHVPSVPSGGWRVRRSPQGEVQAEVHKGDEGRPTGSVTYNHKIIDDARTNLDVYSGLSTSDFKHYQPNAGVNYEYRPHKDMSLGAYGNVQPGPQGRLDPSVGGTFTYLFRRDVKEQEQEQEPEQSYQIDPEESESESSH